MTKAHALRNSMDDLEKKRKQLQLKINIQKDNKKKEVLSLEMIDLKKIINNNKKDFFTEKMFLSDFSLENNDIERARSNFITFNLKFWNFSLNEKEIVLYCKLKTIFKQIKGKRIPEISYSREEFFDMLTKVKK
jgi:hypothetical protein